MSFFGNMRQGRDLASGFGDFDPADLRAQMVRRAMQGVEARNAHRRPDDDLPSPQSHAPQFPQFPPQALGQMQAVMQQGLPAIRSWEPGQPDRGMNRPKQPFTQLPAVRSWNPGQPTRGFNPKPYPGSSNPYGAPQGFKGGVFSSGGVKRARIY